MLRRNGAFWMFDAGEGTQINLQRSGVRPSRIEKVFVTHAHGDHTFGLAGVLCLMGQDFDRTAKVGPPPALFSRHVGQGRPASPAPPP